MQKCTLKLRTAALAAEFGVRPVASWVRRSVEVGDWTGRVGAGNDLPPHTGVRIAEVDTSSAIVVVDLAGLGAARIRPVRHALFKDSSERLVELANDPANHVKMALEPGDMQFINNYHVMHGRTAYADDRADGRVRHLKRLWLETSVLEDRPPYFANGTNSYWSAKRVASRLQVNAS